MIDGINSKKEYDWEYDENEKLDFEKLMKEKKKNDKIDDSINFN